MALAWQEVASKPDFQSLSFEDQLLARQQYFKDVVMPQIDASERPAAFHQFNVFADSIQPVIGMQKPAVSETDSGDTMRGFKTAFEQLPQLGYGLMAAGGATAENLLGEGGISTGIKKAGVKGYQEWGDKIQKGSKESDSLSYSYDKAKEGEFGALVDWLQYGIGYAGGQGIQMLASAGVGSIIGKAGLKAAAEHVASGMVSKEVARISATKEGASLAADQLSKIATSNVAAKIGQTSAIGAQAFGMEGGEIGGDLVSKAEKEGRLLSGDELAKAFGATLGAGALEFVGDKIGLDLMLGKSALLKPAGSMTGFGGKVARGTIAGVAAMPIEGGTEYGQTMLEEYGKGNDPYSAETHKQAFDSAGLGALGGMVHGVVGGAVSSPIDKISESQTTDEAITNFNASLEVPVPNIMPRDVAQGGLDISAISQRNQDAIFRQTLAEQGQARQSDMDELEALINDETADINTRRDALLSLQQQKREALDGAFRQDTLGLPSPNDPTGTLRVTPEGIAVPETREQRIEAERAKLRAMYRTAGTADERGVNGVPRQEAAQVAPASSGSESSINSGSVSAALDTPARGGIDGTGVSGNLAGTGSNRLAGIANGGNAVNLTSSTQNQVGIPATTLETPAGQQSAITEDERIAAKRAAYQLVIGSGAPADVAASIVIGYQNKANERGEPMNLWVADSGATGLVPASRKSPFAGGGRLVATFHPENHATDQPESTAPGADIQPTAQPVAPAAPVKRKSPSFNGNLINDIKQLGGVSQAEFADITGETSIANVKGAGFVFRKDGQRLDNLVTQLNEIGYNIDTNDVDGGVGALRGMLRDALDGNAVRTPAAQERAASEAEQKARKETVLGQAKDAGIKTVARKFTDIERDVIAWLEKKQAADEASLVAKSAEAFASARAELAELLDDAEVSDMLDMLAEKFNGKGIRSFYDAAAKEMTERAKRIREARATPEKDIFGEDHGTQEVLAGNAGEAGQTDAAGTREGDEVAGPVAGAGSYQAQGWDDFGLVGENEAEIAQREQTAEQAQRDKAVALAAEQRADNKAAEEQRQKDNAKNGNAADAFSLTGTEPIGKRKQNAIDKAKAKTELMGQTDLLSQQSAIESIKQSEDIPTADKIRLAAELRNGGVTADDVVAIVGDASTNPEKSNTSEDPAQKAVENDRVDDRIHTLAVQSDLFKRVHEGKVTADEFKASFDALLKNKEGITAELNGMTKAGIFSKFPGIEYRYKSEAKSRAVDAAYRDMIEDFTLGDGYSYGMSSGSMVDSIRTMVEKTTDETLAAYADTIKQKRAEREARNQEALAGMDNPQTLEDYQRIMSAKAEEIGKGATFAQARMAMTLEQRVKYDELVAEHNRGERAKKKVTQQEQSLRAPGEAVETTDIIKTKHTKHGHDLWQFQMVQRVAPEEFKSLVAQAKRLGGDYSSYRGNGAIPGWQFRTEEAAKAFKALVAGDTAQAKDVMSARRDVFADDRSQSAVDRLNEMADALEEKADNSLAQDRKANTERRARFAASAEAAANNDKAMAQTMRNIAQGIEKGTAKFLDRVRQKVQVEMLSGFVRTAQDDMHRNLYESYAEREKHKGEKPTKEVADYATFPNYTAYRSDLASLGRALLETEGTKKLGQRLMKVADDVSDSYLKFAKDNIDRVTAFRTKDGLRAAFPSKAMAELSIQRSGYKGAAIVLPVKRNENLIVLSPSEAIKRGVWEGDNDKRITLTGDFGVELVEAIGKASRRGAKVSVPWQFDNAYDKRKRLAAMDIETPAELRAALREFIGLKESPKEADKIKEMERAMIGRRNDGLDFFPTPSATADEMIETAGIKEGMSVLEPSAGMGHIAERIREAGVDPDVVELSNERKELLEAKGFNVVGRDFIDTEGSYDRIIMNPPFSDGRTAQHVQHAYDLLKPGGRLVALVDEGVFFRGDKKAQAFRDWLERVGATDEKLEEGTFNDPSLPVNTGVNARMLVIDKAETDKGVALFSRRTSPATGITRQSLTDTFARKFPQLSKALDKMLQRGETGQKGGIVLASSDNIAQVFADKTGRSLADAKAALQMSVRIMQYGVHTINDFVIPETPEFSGNMTGDLAYIDGKPIRLPVGVYRGYAHGMNRGYGLNKLAGTADRDTSREPPSYTSDRAENFLRHVVAIANSTNEMYEDSGSRAKETFVIRSSRMREALVIEDRGDHFVIESVRPADKNVWGNPVRADRAIVQPYETQHSVPNEPSSVDDSLPTDRPDSMVRTEQFNFDAKQKESKEERKAPTVTYKARRNVDIKKSVNGDIQAFYDPKSGLTFMATDNLDADTAANVLLHEATHGNQNRAVDASAVNLLTKTRKLAGGKLRAYLDEAANRMVAAGAAQWEGNNLTITDTQEAAPYIVEVIADKAREQGFSAIDGKFMDWVDSQSKAIGKFIRDFVASVRASLLHYGIPLKNVTVDDLVAYAQASMKRAAEGDVKTSGKDVVSGSNKEQSKLLQAWKMLAENDELFQHPASESKDMEQIFEEIAPDILIEHSGGDAELADAWMVYPKDNAGNAIRSTPGFVLLYKDGSVELNVYQFGEGNKGSQVYSAVGNYAYTNGLKFKGDRLGITETGLFRRLENMISLALKFGTTDFMQPHPEQLSKMGIDWKEGKTDHNLEEMIKASYEDTAAKFHRIKDIYYDFDREQFRDSSGNEVVIIDPRSEDTGKRFYSTAGTRPNLVEEARSGGLRAGETTLKRAALSNTFLREETGPSAWGSISAFLHRWAGGEVVKDFVGLAYSRKSIVGDSGRQYTPEQKATMERTGSTITHRSPKEVIQSIWQDAGKKMAQGIVDQFRPVRDISDHAYTLMRLSKGATGAFEAFMHHGKLSLRDGAYDADTSGGLLEKVFYPLGKEATDFLRWVAGNRAERLAKEGKENLFTKEDIDAFKSLSDGKTDFDYTLSNGKVTRDRAMIYRDSLNKFNGFLNNALDINEQSGMIDPESRKYWEHEFYVPFYRVADEQDGGVRGMNIKSGVVRQQAFKKLKGGDQQLNDLMENTLMNFAHLIDAAAKNRAATATLQAAEKVGAARLAEPGEKKTVWHMDNGQKVEYKVEDPYLLEAISSLEYAGLRGPAMDAMSTMKHWLTMGVTASPFFKVRNLIRDSVQAIATADLGYNPLTNVKKGYELTDRSTQKYVSALAGGGLIRFGTMLEGSESKRVRQLIKQGASDEHILDNENKVRAFYDKYLEPAVAWYNETGNRGEEINRMALYDRLISKGVDHATAALMARDLMDFSMQGTWTTVRFLTQIVPFMNARLQGLYKLGRAANEDKARFAIVTGAVALASLALLAAYHDDDDWKKREDWDRDNFWWFKFGGIAFRIPKPFEIGAIGTLAERTAEFMFDDEMTGKRFAEVIMSNAGNQLAMNPVPQAFKPILDVYANKDSFTGRPIETMGMERLAPDYRFKQSTSMVARGLSTAGNTLTGDHFFSPVQVDHMIRSYFGWLGATSVSAADMLVRAASDEPTRPAIDQWKMATGNMVSELEGAHSRYVSQMYDQARELEQAYGTWRHLMKEGKTEEAQAYREDHTSELSRYRNVESVKRQVSKLNERIRILERSNIDKDEKKDKIDALRKQQDVLSRRLSA